ncbi:MAG: ornithine cyclodeaminase family protein [Promethearchaeota archaeon]
MVLFLSRSDLESVLTMTDAITVVEQAFDEFARKTAKVPLRVPIEVEKEEGIVLFMPAYLEQMEAMSCKVVSVFKNNPTLYNLPTINAAVLLIDPKTGQIVSIMDGSYLTAMRTGGVSGVATKYLARKNVENVALIGTGVQAATQLWAACEVRSIEQAKVYSIDPIERQEAFVKQMSEKLNIPVSIAKSSKEAVENADIVLTATWSKTPTFSGDWIKPGTHINGIGSYTPEMQEVDVITVKKAKVVVDSFEASFSEAGDLIIPLKNGDITKEHIYAELGDLVIGKKPGRTSEDEITFFKSVGMAIQDASAAKHAYLAAKKKNIGTEISF